MRSYRDEIADAIAFDDADADDGFDDVSATGDFDEIVDERRDAERRFRISAALELFEDGPTNDERALALQRLGALKAEHRVVVHATRSKASRIRAAAVDALGRFALAADQAILETFTSDPSPSVRSAACRSLGNGGFDDSFDLVLEIAQDANETTWCREIALQAAAKLATDNNISVVLDVAQQLRSVITFASYTATLGYLRGDRARDMLESELKTLLHNPTDVRDASSVVVALRRHPISEHGIELFIQALDALPGARTKCCAVLYKHPDERAREPLERLLRDPGPKVVAGAVQALCALGIGTSMPHFRPFVERDDATAQRIIAALRGSSGADLLHHIALTGAVGLRVAALRALLRCDLHRGIETATALLQDSNPDVRLECYLILSTNSDDPDAYRTLAQHDPVPWINRRFQAESQERLTSSQ